MTDDDFTRAAWAEAEGKFPPPRESSMIYPISALRSHSRGAFLAGAEWARDYLSEQNPTDAEVFAAVDEYGRHIPITDLDRPGTYKCSCGALGFWGWDGYDQHRMLAALIAARDARIGDGA